MSLCDFVSVISHIFVHADTSISFQWKGIFLILKLSTLLKKPKHFIDSRGYKIQLAYIQINFAQIYTSVPTSIIKSYITHPPNLTFALSEQSSFRKVSECEKMTPFVYF